MRVGAISLFAAMLLSAVASTAHADGIVRIVNASQSDLTVRIDGAFGCRAPAKHPNADVDVSNVCSFGTADGSHALEIHYDNGTTGNRAVTITPAGLSLTLTGTE